MYGSCSTHVATQTQINHGGEFYIQRARSVPGEQTARGGVGAESGKISLLKVHGLPVRKHVINLHTVHAPR